MPVNLPELQKISARNLALSINTQMTSDEIFADAKFTQRQRFSGDAVMELVQSRRSDKDMSGKGTEFATEGQLTSFDSTFGFKAECDPWLAGWALAFAMGTDAVTGMGPYTHAISFQETTMKSPMTNVYLEDTNDVKTKYADMALKMLTITYAAKGSIMLDVQMAGTGRFTDGADMALPALVTPTYILNSDTVFSFGPVGAPVNYVGRLLSGNIKIDTGVVNHITPGNGLYGIGMRLGLRKCSFDFVIAAKDVDDVRSVFIADTPSTLTAVSNSGAASQMTITFPNFKMKALKLGRDGNMVIWNISGDETTMYNVAGAGVMTAQVINNVAAYLTAV